MSTRGKVFTACALGGGFGAFLGHQLFYPSGWSLLLGFLLGGLVSYLAYDFRGVLAAIPQAWRKTVDGLSVAFLVFLVFAIVVANALAIVGGAKALNLFLNLSQEMTEWLEVTLAFTLMAGLMTNVFRMVAKDSDFDRPREASIFIIKQLNPFANLLIGVPYLIFIVAKGVVLLLTLLPRFTWNVFVLIHSELRLLCLLYGGLGAVAGTLIAGTLAGTLVGALAGGIFGVLNFEIVSKRLLKLVPSR